MIQLYKANNTNYELNGDVVLRPLSCIQTMELKTGMNELELIHSYDEYDRWKQIEKHDIISTPTNHSFRGRDNQRYRVYEIVKGEYEITVKARHIFFDLINTTLIDVRPTGKTAEEALNIILAGTGYRGFSNISTISTAYYIRKNIIEALQGNDDNSFINRWGGELFVDNERVYLNTQIGNDNGVRLAWGKNILGYEETENVESIVTRIIPVGAEGLMLPEIYVDSPLISAYPFVAMKEIKYDKVKVKTSPEDEEGFNTVVEAQAELRRLANLEFVNGIDKPLINYKIDTLDLTKLKRYEDFKVFEFINLGDVVYVEYSPLNVNIKARVVKLEFDCIKEEVKSLEIGNFVNSLRI